MTPSTTTSRHMILGAGGIIGRTLAETLRSRGIEPRLIDRTQLAGPDAIAVDLLDAAQARDAVHGADVVHFAVALPYDDRVWAEQFPPLVANVIAAVRAANARLVFLDNVFLYGPAAGIQTEDTPHAARTRKGVVRRQLVEQLEASDIDWVIARSADFYGPGADTNGLLNAFVLAKLRSREPVAWLGGVDWKHSFTYTRDIADAMTLLAQVDGVSRTQWHVPTAPAITVRELVAIAARQLGRSTPDFQVMDLPTVLEYARTDAVMHATSEMFYQFDRDYIVGSERFQRRFGLSPTSYEAGIRASLVALGELTS